MPEGEGSTSGFEFTGSGAEYFRIWIVNLLLTILTLGIYSAWAKVRREQYFHRNTLLAGSGFDYLGQPLAILKGRLIAWGLVVLLGVAQHFSPPLYGILLLVALPLVPWLLMRSMKFRATNTAYRGLRFRHRGTYGQAAAAMLGHGLLSVVTLGLWTPMWMRAMKRFQLGGLSFGDADFSCEPPAGGFYRTYLVAGLMMVVPMAAGVAAIVAVARPGGGQGVGAFAAAALLPFVFGVVLVALVRPYLAVRLANLTWNATRVGAHRFASTLALGPYARLVAGNFVLLLLTLGFYWPWAKVRETDYRLRHLSIEGADLDAFVAQAEAASSAVGEEIVDAFDIDVAL